MVFVPQLDDFKTIEYKGIKFRTKSWVDVDYNEWQDLKNQYYSKPDFELVKKQFRTIANGGTNNNHVSNYYVKDLLAKVRNGKCLFSIEDAWECKDLFGFIYARTLDNKKVFPDKDPKIKHIETAFRIGGGSIIRKATKFPIKTVDQILTNYAFEGANWYDYSCGWGDRLTGALKNKVNYFGTDPNYLLTARLEQLAKDYKNEIGTNTATNIYTQGSEILIPDLVGKMDIAFSSPPYYDLEDYKIGEQSYKEGITYDNWLKGYVVGTTENIYQYLKPDGLFLLNIKNQKDYPMLDDWIQIAKAIGFEVIRFENLKNITRNCGRGQKGGYVSIDNNEYIAVMRKN